MATISAKPKCIVMEDLVENHEPGGGWVLDVGSPLPSHLVKNKVIMLGGGRIRRPSSYCDLRAPVEARLRGWVTNSPFEVGTKYSGSEHFKERCILLVDKQNSTDFTGVGGSYKHQKSQPWTNQSVSLQLASSCFTSDHGGDTCISLEDIVDLK